MKNIGGDSFENFIERKNNFFSTMNINEEYFRENLELLKKLHCVSKLIKTKYGEKGNFDKEDLLYEIFGEIYKIVIPHNEEFKIFGRDSFVMLCPDYLCDNKQEIEEIMKTNYYDNASPEDFLNFQYFKSVFDTTLFSSLSSFVYNSKRGKSLTQSEFIRRHCSIEYFNGNTMDENSIHDDVKMITKAVHKASYTSEINRFKQRIKRFTSNSDYRVLRTEWSTIPLCAEQELSVLHKLVEEGEKDNILAKEYKDFRKLYNLMHKARKSPKDAGYQDRLRVAYEKTITRIKKLSYENYLELGKLLLSKLSENELFYGISLYRFETQYNYYAITSHVNELLSTIDEDERESILLNSVMLSKIHFPNLFNIFQNIENHLYRWQCVTLYRLLLADIIILSHIILDEFIEEGCFGGDWYEFFNKILNDMVDDVLYIQEDIDTSNKTKVQKCYEEILAASIEHYFEDNQ